MMDLMQLHVQESLEFFLRRQGLKALARKPRVAGGPPPPLRAQRLPKKWGPRCHAAAPGPNPLAVSVNALVVPWRQRRILFQKQPSFPESTDCTIFGWVICSCRCRHELSNNLITVGSRLEMQTGHLGHESQII